jgi:hypothetical protein
LLFQSDNFELVSKRGATLSPLSQNVPGQSPALAELVATVRPWAVFVFGRYYRR